MKTSVFYNKIPAGELTKDSSGYIFKYYDLYLYDTTLPAISLSFPKRTEPYHSKLLFPFFYGLLSEGENKEIICRTFKIDAKDHFSLLLNSAAFDTIGPITVGEIQ